MPDRTLRADAMIIAVDKLDDIALETREIRSAISSMLYASPEMLSHHIERITVANNKIRALIGADA